MKAYCLNEYNKVITAKDFKTSKEAHRFCRLRNSRCNLETRYWTTEPWFLRDVEIKCGKMILK